MKSFFNAPLSLPQQHNETTMQTKTQDLKKLTAAWHCRQPLKHLKQTSRVTSAARDYPYQRKILSPV